MIRAMAVVAGTLALTACNRAEPPAPAANVFGWITPLRIMQWWRACDVPLVLKHRPHPSYNSAQWKLECREDLGGDTDLRMLPLPVIWGALQQGWVITTDEQFHIHAIGVIAPPERFDDRAKAMIRDLMPAWFQDKARRSLELPPPPRWHSATLPMNIAVEPHQPGPLIHRHFAGETFRSTTTTWITDPILYVP